ncbi:reverse transcriptase domain-containing protein [Tanacetum coccineum]
MRTRSQSRNSNRQQQQVNPTFVEPFNLVEPIENQAPPVVTMDDNRTMTHIASERIPEGYEDAFPYITDFSELHQLDTFYNALNSNDQDSLNSAAGGNFLDKMLRDCLRIIESKSKVRNSRNKPVVAKVSTSNSTPGISPDVAELKDMVKALLLDKKNQSQAPTPVKAVEENYVTCGCAHSHTIVPPSPRATFYRALFIEYVSQAAAANFNQGNTGYRARLLIKFDLPVFLPSNVNPRWTIGHGATTITKYKDVQPPVVQVQTQVPNSEPVVAPVSAVKPNPKPSIPYLSRLNDQKICEKANNQICEKANNQMEKFYQIFQDLRFDISFTDALILMPKFASTIKSLLNNKEKLFELAKTPLNEHFSAVLLNKLPEKLGDPGKFIIPCDFPRMDECLALADLSASINLMPLSVWKKLSLLELNPTCMTLELADRLISRPIGIAEDVYVKVGKFQFPADFVVADFDADPRVPLILGRSFLKTGRAFIDVYEGELTHRVGKEAVTFNLDQTSRYSSNYDDNSVNRIDVIDMACEEYSQEVLGFSDVIASGNPTPYYDPIVSTSSPTLTPFGDSDFLLEEVNAFLALEDDPTSPEVDHSYYDSEGDILLLEAFLNDDPSLPPPTQGMYLPEIQKELKICEAKNDKSSIDEPPEVELKDLPPHLEYAFLEGDDKLPVIIAKDLSVEEKAALIKVLKSHKRAIAWKLSDIKGINPEFCTHKILMEEDYKPAVQHQRRVNPKIHDVIKKEVEKLLDAGLIYPISDSPWDGVYALTTMLKRCEDTNLCLNWEKSHFMVKEGIVLGHKISKNGIEVDKAKVDVIAKLPHPPPSKEFRIFLVTPGIQQEKEKPAAQSFTPYGNFSMIDDVEVLMRYIYTFLRKFSRIPFGVTLKVLSIAWERFDEIKHALTDKQYRQEDIQELMSKLLKDVRNINEELSEYINCPSWNRPTFYDDDDDAYTIIYRKPKAITPNLPTVEPDNSLIMGDEHLDTIPKMESDEIIKSSVEILVPIPSESKGISDDTCDVLVGEDSSTFDALNDNSEILSDSNDDGTSSDDDDFEDIEYVSLEEVNDVDQEEKEFDLEDILQIQDVILREKLLNISRLITNIESLKRSLLRNRYLRKRQKQQNRAREQKEREAKVKIKAKSKRQSQHKVNPDKVKAKAGEQRNT